MCMRSSVEDMLHGRSQQPFQAASWNNPAPVWCRPNGFSHVSAVRQALAPPLLFPASPAPQLGHEQFPARGVLHQHQVAGNCTHAAAAASPQPPACSMDAAFNQWGSAPGLGSWKLHLHGYHFSLFLSPPPSAAAWVQLEAAQPGLSLPLAGSCACTAAEELGVGRNGDNVGSASSSPAPA